MSKISGAEKILLPKSMKDKRGLFVKLFSVNPNSDFKIAEVYFSKTKKGFVRGMHYQSGKFANNKLVYCSNGAVHDILIDLRKKSETYLNVYAVRLIADQNFALLIPKGVAHGFQALTKNATVIYLSDRKYSKKHDKGVFPLSKEFRWPIKIKGISERDKSLPKLNLSN
jgi:dTDP-4-dehydrorhamnose 3,5-epimerase